VSVLNRQDCPEDSGHSELARRQAEASWRASAGAIATIGSMLA
jgi:hypothetical protein